MMVTAYGEVELLQELLLLPQSNEVININTQTSRGLTALHFAAVCFNPGGGDDGDKQLQVVQMLLDAHCDPNIRNSSAGRVRH